VKRGAAILPESLPPVGISREQAAAFIGIGESLFDRLVAARKMPEPRMVGGRLIWDVAEVATAFRAIPHRSEPITPLDGDTPGVNPWD
jgi:predicted DNA-binding transcriptional regulator AlpA